MDIFFIENLAALNYLDADQIKKCVLVSCTCEIQKELETKNIKSIMYDDLMTADAKNTNDFAFQLSQIWYKDGDRDFTVFNRISLGYVYEFAIWMKTGFAYKFLISVDALVIKERPAVVYYDASMRQFRKRILKCMETHLKTLGVVLQRLGNEKESTALLLDMGNFFAHRLKKRIRSVGYNTYKRLFGKRKQGKYRVLVSFYSGLDKLLYELEKTNEFEIVLTTKLPNTVQKHFQNGGPLELDLPILVNFSREEQDSLKNMQLMWQRVESKEDYRNKFEWKGYNIFEAIKPELQLFFTKIKSEIAGEVKIYQKGIKKAKLACVVVPFDITPKERILIEIAKLYEIPTMTILHGLPSRYNNIENCQTDYLVVWGEGIGKRYEKLGVPKERIFCFGSPKLDEYLLNHKIVEKNGKPNILVLSFPCNEPFWSKDYAWRNYAKLIVRALKNIGAGIIFKLHPSESIDDYKDIFENSGIKIVREGSIKDLLIQSDLVIASFTTVLLEAMVLMKPMLYFKPGPEVEYPEPFGVYNLEEITTEEELRKQVEAFLTDGKTNTTEYKKILIDYAGPLDGNSSARIVGLISRIIKHEKIEKK